MVRFALYFYKVFVIYFILVGATLASVIKGKVIDHLSENGIPEALISVEKADNKKVISTQITDETGAFRLKLPESGVYNIEAYHDGYYGNILFDLKILSDKEYSVEIRLLKKEEGASGDYCFLLGGIKICAQRGDIIPEEPATVRKVDSGEIEHLQASSLGDILLLIPGVEKSRNPGLGSEIQLGIRTASSGPGSIDLLESFGTEVIVDGTPLTNDANANWMVQTGAKGIDLRTIPADNIESVEVISGIPSVEYGNFSNGIIKVKTRSGMTVSRLKMKFNPDTKTGSFSSGHRVGDYIFDYHLNYGFSERDLRKEGDEYHRIYLKGNLSRNLLNDNLKIRYQSAYKRLFDEEKPTDIYRIKRYNRGYVFNNSLDMKYKPSSDMEYSGFFSLHQNRRRVHKERWVAEQVVIDDSIYTGYVGKVDEIGREWQALYRLKAEVKAKSAGILHRFLFGTEGNRQWNTGRGVVLDSVFNYHGPYSKERSYSFNRYKPIVLISAYAEDNMKGNLLGNKYNLIAGLRYDIINAELGENFRLIGRQGAFLSPRVNFQYFLSDDLRFRVGGGQSVKNISLAYIYKPPAYQKYITDSTLVVEMQPQQNPDLKAYTTTKYEASLDWKIKDMVGFSFTFYSEQSDDRPSSIIYPWGYKINPDTLTVASYSVYRNRGWKRSQGMELVIRTKRIHGIEFEMSATDHVYKSGRRGLIYDSNPDTSWEDIWYKPSSSWRKKVILNYTINYISQRFGLWVTLDIQHIPYDHNREIFRSNSTVKEVDGIERLFYQGMTYWYERMLDKYDNRFLFNFRISKSVSQNSEISLYINNLLDDRAIMKNPYSGYSYELNPEIYYGLEMSFQW